MARKMKETHNKHLRDPDIAAEYLSEALEDGEDADVLMALRNIAQAHEDDMTGLAAPKQPSISHLPFTDRNKAPD